VADDAGCILEERKLRDRAWPRLSFPNMDLIENVFYICAMNPIVHSESSMKKFKGETEEDFKQFMVIHKKMDCSKGWVPDNRHRTLTHHMFWVMEVMIPIFGDYIILSNGKRISVKDICEQHILEDYRMKFIPTPQDFIQEMKFQKWMQNGAGVPPSAAKLYPELFPPQEGEEESTSQISTAPTHQPVTPTIEPIVPKTTLQYFDIDSKRPIYLD